MCIHVTKIKCAPVGCLEGVFSILFCLDRPWFVFVTECEFDNTDMEGLVVMNGGMYHVFVYIDQ
jgi:hypothetical protein